MDENLFDVAAIVHGTRTVLNTVRRLNIDRSTPCNNAFADGHAFGICDGANCRLVFIYC